MNAIDHDSTATIIVSKTLQTPTQRYQLTTAMNSNMIRQPPYYHYYNELDYVSLSSGGTNSFLQQQQQPYHITTMNPIGLRFESAPSSSNYNTSIE